jgi:outer membrane lipoprotein SlyB
MQIRRRMMARMLCVALAASLAACASTSTTSTTWVEPRGNWTSAGTVESVQEIVQRVQGQPALGAVAGALIGGFLFRGHGPARLWGAATGATIGAIASQGNAEYRTYQVLVRFDDGSRGLFVYRDYAPFAPGARVELTPRGLAASAVATQP